MLRGQAETADMHYNNLAQICKKRTEACDSLQRHVSALWGEKLGFIVDRASFFLFLKCWLIAYLANLNWGWKTWLLPVKTMIDVKTIISGYCGQITYLGPFLRRFSDLSSNFLFLPEQILIRPPLLSLATTCYKTPVTFHPHIYNTLIKHHKTYLYLIKWECLTRYSLNICSLKKKSLNVGVRGNDVTHYASHWIRFHSMNLTELISVLTQSTFTLNLFKGHGCQDVNLSQSFLTKYSSRPVNKQEKINKKQIMSIGCKKIMLWTPFNTVQL